MGTRGVLLAALACALVIGTRAQLDYCNMWEVYDDTHSSNGVYQSSADSSVEDCIQECNSTSTCLWVDYNASPSVSRRCYTGDTLKKIGKLNMTKQYRPLRDISCPTPTFFEATECVVYCFKFFRGLSSYQESNEASYADCRDRCIADMSCYSFDYADSTGLCRLYDSTFGYEIAADSTRTTSLYVVDGCLTRDQNEQGFFLHAESKRVASGGTTTVGNTYTDCWDDCFGNLFCQGFDWHDGDSSCTTHTSSTINGTTSNDAGYYHHTLLTSADAAAMSVTSPGAASAPSAIAGTTCLQVIEYVNKRSFRASTAVEGNPNIQYCLQHCYDNLGGSCATMDFEYKERPFKGIRCYTYASTPTRQSTVQNRNQIQIDSTSCPAIAGSTTSGGCTWNLYADKAGVLLSGWDSTATSVTDCLAECAADPECWAADWDDDDAGDSDGDTTLQCTLYNSEVAYWFKEETGTDHYVATSCS